MPSPQPAAEFSARDVLQQLDHRLSLIETDVRENNAKIDDLKAETEVKIDNLRTEIIDKIDGLEAKTETKIEVEIRELRREFNGKFNLVIGLVLTSWLSMMGTLLFKL